MHSAPVFLKHKVNLLIAMLLCFSIIVGVSVGVGAYFGALKNESIAAKQYLDNLVQQQVEKNLEGITYDTLLIVNSMKALFERKNFNIDPYVDYAPYCDKSSSITASLNVLGYNSVVPNEQKNVYISNVRNTFKRDYSTFDITARDSSNKKISAPNATTYYPALYFSPFNSQTISGSMGFDHGSQPVRLVVLEKVRNTGEAAASSRVTLTSNSAAGFLIYAPVKNVTGEIIAVAFASVRIGDFLLEAIGDISVLDLVVILFDQDDNNNFLYSTIVNGMIPGFNNVSQMTIADHLSVINNAQFYVERNFTVLDRNWKAVFVPTPSFFGSTEISRDSFQKYIAACVPPFLSLALAIFVAFFIKRLQHVEIVRKSKKEQEEDLQVSQTKQKELLRKLVAQDTFTRTILDNIPDLVFIVDNDGRIVTSNRTFDTAMELSADDYQVGVFIGSFFPELNARFFERTKHFETIVTNMRPKNGGTVAVSVKVRSLTNDDTDTDSKSDTTSLSGSRTLSSTSFSSRNKMIKREEFTIIAHLASETTMLLAEQEKQVKEDELLIQTKKLQARLRFRNFYQAFNDFTISEGMGSQEMDFLMQLKQYKHLDSQEKRVEVMNRIWTEYLVSNRLDCSQEIVAMIQQNMNESPGGWDVFLPAETYALQYLVQHVYYKFKGNVAVEKETK
jgi:CHASE1-domain containing sensor protein